MKIDEQSTCPAFLRYFFAALCISHTTYAMNLIQAWRNEKTADAFVSNFPAMTFNEARAAWKNLSDAHQQRIELVDKKRNKGKENLIFNIVRYLPAEISENILLLFFNSKTAGKIAKDDFLKMPIGKAFEKYAYSREMVENSQHWHTGLDLRTIPLAEAFMMTEHLQTVARVFCNKQQILGRSELAVLHAIASKSSLKMDLFKDNNFQYRWYPKYTFNEFLQCALPAGIISGVCTVPLGLLWLSSLIRLYGCEKTVILENIVAHNTAVRELTRLILESGKEELLPFLNPIVDEMEYSWANYCKINAPFLLGIPVVGAFVFTDESGCKFSERLKKSIAQGLIFGVPLAILLFCLSDIPFETFPGSFLGLIGVICTVSIGVSTGLRSQTVRYWREVYVDWKTIADDLQNTDIVILRS